MNFGNCAFLIGVEDEGSVGALIAIDIGEGKAGSFGFFGQIPEGLLMSVVTAEGVCCYFNG